MMGFRYFAKTVVSVGVAIAVMGSAAFASTLTTNSHWVIDRSGTSTRYRVVAYGDSIYAGWFGDVYKVKKTAGPEIASEYQATYWNADMEVIRRTISGARADKIYNDKIVGERSWMQNSKTKIVDFEMCGNNYLQARSALKNQTGTCSFSGLDSALSTCKYYMGRAMDYINANKGANVTGRNIANIYYPGYNADNALSKCSPQINYRDKFLPYLAKSNWAACDLARQKGFTCTDAFAAFMARDTDWNGNGKADSTDIKYVLGESESSYVNKITVTYKSSLRDSNYKVASNGSTYDYMQSDDTHPTNYGTTNCGFGLWPGGTCTGSSAQAVPPNSYAQGHTRLGREEYLKWP